jgi:hypothetical protein
MKLNLSIVKVYFMNVSRILFMIFLVFVFIGVCLINQKNNTQVEKVQVKPVEVVVNKRVHGCCY